MTVSFSSLSSTTKDISLFIAATPLDSVAIFALPLILDSV